MRGVRYVFLHSGEFDSTVFDSQVVDSMVAVAEHGVSFDLVVLMHGSPYLHKREYNRRRRAEVQARIPGQLRIYPTIRKETRAGDLGAAAVLMADLLRSPARRTVIHARGDGAGYFASLCRRIHPSVRFVYDIRGDSVAEHLHHARQVGLSEDKRDRLVRQLERECAGAMRGADAVLSVSNVLRDRFLARYGGPKDRFTVIPCVADTGKFFVDDLERQATRRELGLENRFVVVYPGRFGRWHYGPEMIGVVRGIMDAQPDAYFLVLTPDLDEATSLASAELPEGRWSVRTARHAEVPRYLRAADLGLLLREPDPLNEVACPTKFAEYMLSGLPIVISAGIGDCTAFIHEQLAGVVLERPDPALAANAVAQLRSRIAAPQRAKIAEAALAQFSRQRAASVMAALYRRLAQA